MSDRAARKELGWRIWQQLPLILVLVALWMLLWGTLSWLTLASGGLVAVVVTRLFYLPPVELSGRFNPLWLIVFLARFAVDLVAGSFQVALAAFSRRGAGFNSIVAVGLVTRSDFIMTLTAISISLKPGSLVVEVDRENSILYLHAIRIGDEEQAQALRERVLSRERGLVRALGSRDDVERTRT